MRSSLILYITTFSGCSIPKSISLEKILGAVWIFFIFLFFLFLSSLIIPHSIFVTYYSSLIIENTPISLTPPVWYLSLSFVVTFCFKKKKFEKSRYAAGLCLPKKKKKKKNPKVKQCG